MINILDFGGPLSPLTVSLNIFQCLAQKLLLSVLKETTVCIAIPRKRWIIILYYLRLSYVQKSKMDVKISIAHKLTRIKRFGKSLH